MATVRDPYREDEEREAQAQPQAAPDVAMGRGTPAPAAGPSLAAPGQPAAPAPQAGRFVDFQRVFRANQGGATAAANKLAQGVQEQGETAQAGQTALVGRFETGVNAGTPGAARPLANFGAAGAQATPVARREVAFGGGAPTVPRETAKAGAGATYTGPNSLTDDKEYANVETQSKIAEQRANALGTSAGRQALVGEMGGTRGQNRIDAALVGQAGQGRFQGLRRQFGGLTRQLGEASTVSQGQSDTARRQVGDYARQNQGVLNRYGKADAETEFAEQWVKDHPKTGAGHDYQNDASDPYRGDSMDPYNPQTWSPENQAAYAERTEPNKLHPTGTMVWTYEDGRTAVVDVLETPRQKQDRADLVRLQQIARDKTHNQAPQWLDPALKVVAGILTLIPLTAPVGAALAGGLALSDVEKQARTADQAAFYAAFVEKARGMWAVAFPNGPPFNPSMTVDDLNSALANSPLITG